MRFNILVLFICSKAALVCTSQSIDQHLPQPDKLSGVYITIDDNCNIPIESVLNLFSTNNHLNFLYDPNQIDVNRQIAFKQGTWSIKDILNTICENSTIMYTIKGDTIVLIKRPVVKCKIKGTITEKPSGLVISYVTIVLPYLGKGCISDSMGKYYIAGIQAGNYEINFKFLGYKEITRYIQLRRDTVINVSMEPAFTELEAVTITPGTYNIANTEPTMNALSSKEILQSPNFSKDITRTLRVIPGIANNDVTSKPRIRGGDWDETAVYIDNFEIYEPYHFEEVNGLTTIFSTDYAKEIKISTGGFTAKNTKKMSGIINVKTEDYINENQNNFSADLLNASAFCKERISDNVNVQFGFRRGYLNILLQNSNINDTKINPVYYDMWGKLNVQINTKNMISFDFLQANEDFNTNTSQNLSTYANFHNTKSNNYEWITWKWMAGKNYFINTTLGYQDLYFNSNFQYLTSITSNNSDQRIGHIACLNEDHVYTINPNNTLEFGFEYKGFRTLYRFNEIRYDAFNSTPNNIIIDTINVYAKPTGSTFAGYLQDSWSILQRINIIPGLRISEQSFTNGWYVAPRLAAKAEIVKNLTLKLASGIYYQPDHFEKLKSFEGQTYPLKESSQCIHYVASLDYIWENIDFKAEGYLKDYVRLIDDYRFDIFERIPLDIDKDFHTTSGLSKGIECSLRLKYGNDNILSFNYTWANNIIRNDSNQITFRNFDRRHTVSLNSLQNLPGNWYISIFALFHTGEPYTPYNVSFIGQTNDDKNIAFYSSGFKNSARYPNYYSVDCKFEKLWIFKKTRMSIYLNVDKSF